MSRGGFRISVGEYEQDKAEVPNWLKQFADTIRGKSAVEVARDERTESISEQINSIMGSSSKFSTTEEAVAHYQEKTGLKEYLNRLEANTDQPTKQANNLVYDTGFLSALDNIQTKMPQDPKAAFD